MRNFAAVLLFLGTTAAWAAVPDPRDSIILESKVVAPGTYLGRIQDTAAFVYLRVWITNKDTLFAINLPLEERSVSGGAYLISGYPRNGLGAVNRLTNTLSDGYASFTRYNSSSPDSIFLAAWHPQPDFLIEYEPPNSVRKPFWELKFDSVLLAYGQVEFDTIKILAVRPGFGNLYGRVEVNFAKSVVTVVPASKGDLNSDFLLTPADVVLILHCVMRGSPPFGGLGACDLNCDGEATAADLVVLLNAVFLDTLFPC